jgi:hypothetical protein
VGENYNQVMMAITLDEPIPLAEAAPGIDKDYLAIVDNCLQKDREQRPPTMDSLATMLDVYVQARASGGIPAIDLGEAGAPRSARIGSTHRLVSQVSPRIPSTRPPAPVETATTQRSDPIQMTVNAVTVVDRPPRSGDPARTTTSRSRFPVVALLAVLGAGAIGGLLWMFAFRGGSPSTSPSTNANNTASATTATNATTTTPTETNAAATETATGSASAPAIETATAQPTASAPATASATTTTSAMASTSASTKIKPPKFPPPISTKPLTKPSTSATDDGPASVGNGPGF